MKENSLKGMCVNIKRECVKILLLKGECVKSSGQKKVSSKF